MGLHSLEYFKSRKRQEPDWIIRGFLKRMGAAIIMGEPKKACKSWIVLNGVWNLSEGKPFLPLYSGSKSPDNSFIFTPPRPLRTVYFTQEDSEDDLHDRLEIMYKAGRKPNDRLWTVDKDLSLKFDSNKGIRQMEDFIGEVETNAGPIDLIVYDPMRRFHSQSENDSDVISRFWDKINQFNRKYNTAAFIVHHVIKPSGDKDKWYDQTSPYMARGSSDIYAGGDAFINAVPLRSPKHKIERNVEVHFESKRGAGLSPMRLKVNFKTGRVEFLSYVGGKKEREDEDDRIKPM